MTRIALLLDFAYHWGHSSGLTYSETMLILAAKYSSVLQGSCAVYPIDLFILNISICL